MKKREIVIFVILFLNVFVLKAQQLYTPGGTVGNNSSDPINVGVGVSTPNYQFEVFGNSSTNTPDLALVHRYFSSKTGHVEYDWQFENSNGYLKLNYGSSSLGYPSSLTTKYQFSPSSLILDANTFLSINRSSGTILRLYDILVSQETYGLKWNMNEKMFDIYNGGLKLSGRATFSIDGSLLPDNSYAIYVANADPTVKVFASVIDGVEKFVVGAGGGVNATGLNVVGDAGLPNFTVHSDGRVFARQIEVTLANLSWADYVFADDYELMSITELEKFVKENSHLPGVPSAEEVAENGIDLGEMDKILLEKIEELSLYIIEQQKEIHELRRLLTE